MPIIVSILQTFLDKGVHQDYCLRSVSSGDLREEARIAEFLSELWGTGRAEFFVVQGHERTTQTAAG